MRADPHKGMTMPHTLTFPIALIIASLLLSGCMRIPEEPPILAAFKIPGLVCPVQSSIG